MDEFALAQLTRQLVGVVGTRLLDPLEIVLESAEAVDGVRGRCETAARGWARRLLGDDDTDAALAVSTILVGLYPEQSGVAGFNPPDDWWRTPLGRTVVARVGHPDRIRVPYALAGAMLGMTRQGVHDLVRRGKLARHPDGGVTVASVRERVRSRT